MMGHFKKQVHSLIQRIQLVNLHSAIEKSTPMRSQSNHGDKVQLCAACGRKVYYSLVAIESVMS